MVKKAVLFALVFVGLSSTAWAQTDTRIQVSVLFGYTLADGVSGDARITPGGVFDRIDPTDGGNLGFSVGFMVNPQTEIGFMYRRQFSQAELSGPVDVRIAGDMSVDSYHGYFAYYFGDPEARVNPYFLGGFGATSFGDVTYNVVGTNAQATTQGQTFFSSTWGAGIRINAGQHFAIKTGVAWTPTYIKSDAAGWWCDPYWGGCYIVGNAQYANQFHFEGGFTFRF